MRSEIPAQDLEVGGGKTFASQFIFLVAWEKRLHSRLSISLLMKYVIVKRPLKGRLWL